MGAPVVRVPGQLAQGVVSDHEIGLELSDVCDEAADGLVEGSVDEAYGTAAC